MLLDHVTIIGIDPGFEGAFAFYEPHEMLGVRVMRAEPIPVTKTRKPPRRGKKTERVETEYDERAICDLLSKYNSTNAFVFLEKQQPMLRWNPRRWNEKTKKYGVTENPSIQATWNLAAGFYTLSAIISCYGISRKVVMPKEWQRDMLSGVNCSDTKAASVYVASKMFPDLDLRRSDRCKNPSDGISDAALICMWGFRWLQGASLKAKSN